MSLILDALKKVEREEAAGKPRVVVVGSVPWGERSPRSRRVPLALGAMLALGLLALGGWWRLHPAAPLATAERPPAPKVAPSAVTAPPPTALAPTPDDAQPAVRAPDSRPAAVPAPRAADTPLVAERPGAPSGAPATRSVTPPAVSSAPARPAAPAAVAVAPGPMPELRLAAISVRDGEPVAIVNDRLVREGDSFDGVRIVRIGEAEVEVEFRGQRRVLRF